jgi:hypothetical protein
MLDNSEYDLAISTIIVTGTGRHHDSGFMRFHALVLPVLLVDVEWLCHAKGPAA